MKRLIVSGDDFGLSHGINIGIIDAFRSKTLTSASIMANAAYFDEAVALSKNNAGLSIGVHLNIIRGRPVLESTRVSTLVGRNGHFNFSLQAFLKMIIFGQIGLIDIEREFRAQIEKVLMTGLKIAHLNSEKHIHCYPKIFKIVIKLAKEYNIHSVRYINEELLLSSLGRGRVFKRIQICKSKILSYLSSLSKNILDKNQIMYTDHSFGIACSGKITPELYQTILNLVRDGNFELILHPGYIDNEQIESNGMGRFSIKYHRQEELDTLIDDELPKKISNLNIRLIGYSEL